MTAGRRFHKTTQRLSEESRHFPFHGWLARGKPE
jgi:hypothetical protein